MPIPLTPEESSDRTPAPVMHPAAAALSADGKQPVPAVGFHAGFAWFAQQCEYDARPVTRAEEVDRLTAVVEQSTKTLATALATLERIQRVHKES